LACGPLTARPIGLDPSESYNREREIRRETGRGAAGAEFLRAVEADDLETARALLLAPGLPWVTSDIRRRGEEAFARRTAPDVWTRLQAVEVLQDNVTVLANQVGQWLIHLGATPDAVQKALGD